MPKTYRVEGSKSTGYAVLEDDAIVYDLLESKSEAQEIADICNSGIGPDWESVSVEIERRAEQAGVRS